MNPIGTWRDLRHLKLTLKTLPKAPEPRCSRTENPRTTLSGGRFWSTAALLSLRTCSCSSCHRHMNKTNPLLYNKSCLGPNQSTTLFHSLFNCTTTETQLKVTEGRAEGVSPCPPLIQMSLLLGCDGGISKDFL